MMEQRHSLLKRQLKRCFGDHYQVPEEWAAFIQAVDEAYEEFDDDREMLERSLELSSQELLQANSEVRAVFQAIPDLLFHLDSTGTILSCKAGTTGGLMLEPQELLGKRIQDVPNKDVGIQFQNAIESVLREKSPLNIGYSLATQGQQQFFEARLVPLLQNEIVVIIRNITELKHLEERFRQSQKMEAFGQLAAGVAHDFNNILTVIQGNLSLLGAGIIPKEEEGTAIDDAITASKRAANLTRQLLTFGRRQPLQPRELDLNEVVSNLTKMLHRIIGEHIMLEAHYAPGGAPVVADIGMMEQVIVNLAVNSRDAMPKGGKLIIRLVNVVVNENMVSFETGRNPGEFIRLDISDTGIGIPPENMPRIFEPFFTTKEVGKGSGLGLATVFTIVQQHRGWIEVESEPGSGTTFRIHLPRRSTAAAVFRVETSGRLTGSGGSETILLVEDETSVRQFARRLLASHGYQILEAESGPAALKIWHEHGKDIDLLVTDMVMPGGMNGRELAERLRQDRQDLKVIYCSGYTDEVLGADSPLRNNPNFLEKPVEPHQFIERVRACLDGL
jgi:two-component system, cell cycle sensor histidine kinase and response regulator CckA